MKVYESTLILTMTRSEKIKYTCDFTDLLSGDTIATVATPSQIVGSNLLFGTPLINSSGTVTVDGETIAINKAVQYTIDARTAAPNQPAVGSARVRVVVTTAGGDVIGLDCRLQIVA